MRSDGSHLLEIRRRQGADDPETVDVARTRAPLVDVVSCRRERTGGRRAGMRERLAETIDDDARLLRRERRETLCWPLECSLPHGTTGITVELTLSRNGVSLSSRLFLCADALISMTSEGGVSRLMGM